MRISLNWLKKYVKIPEAITNEELIRLIGARLVEVEGVIDETHKYDKIYVARVESCEKIPETHLTLCQIDVGGNELVQVVCGAPNVRQGMLAAWIAPGAIVPASVHEDAPFVIGKRKMRGYESNGMLAGADELDFGDDHSGIVEINPEIAQPGDLLADVFELRDLILEIENKSLTHRPDCFGIIGFAREVSGILGQDFQSGLSRDASSCLSLQGSSLTCSPLVAKALGRPDLKICIEEPKICSRYSAVVVEKHGELEKKYLTWEDTVISKSGMKPISPIVDVTNYLMLLTGQPLHAFDYDKFVTEGGGDAPEIRVRLAREGEKLVLLDEREVELTPNDIVICSKNVPVALAGAMGGLTTEISDDTKNVIIESATFSLYNLRKTQMAHGIFTEAITRFTKWQPPYQTMAVAKECAKILGNGMRVVGVVDEYPEPEGKIVVKITTDIINDLLGTSYAPELIVKTLENVGFCINRDGNMLRVEVPEWRTDIHIEEDIIEEVGRLLGYDNIEPVLPLHATANHNQMWTLKKRIRKMMVKFGANEVLTYSFVSGKLLEKAGQDSDNSYKIMNSISPELQYVRQSIVPSLLDKTYLNEKLPVEKFAIFEINKAYRKNDGLNDEKVPIEKTLLGCVIAERKNKDTAYYKAKKYVAKVLDELGVEVEYKPVGKDDSALVRPYEPKRAAEIVVGDKILGVVGELRNSVKAAFKLAPYVAGFELELELLQEFACVRKRQIAPDAVKSEDLTVTTSDNYGVLASRINKVITQYGAEAKIVPKSVYQPNNSESKNISVHLEFTKYVDGVMAELEKL